MTVEWFTDGVNGDGTFKGIWRSSNAPTSVTDPDTESSTCAFLHCQNGFLGGWPVSVSLLGDTFSFESVDCVSNGDRRFWRLCDPSFWGRLKYWPGFIQVSEDGFAGLSSLTHFTSQLYPNPFGSTSNCCFPATLNSFIVSVKSAVKTCESFMLMKCVTQCTAATRISLTRWACRC